MRLGLTSPTDIHPVIAEYIAIFGGEPVEVNVPGICRYSCASHPHIYLPAVEELQSIYDRTDQQAVLFVEGDQRWLEHPFTGSVRNPPGGTFYRFTRTARS